MPSQGFEKFLFSNEPMIKIAIVNPDISGSVSLVLKSLKCCDMLVELQQSQLINLRKKSSFWKIKDCIGQYKFLFSYILSSSLNKN